MLFKGWRRSNKIKSSGRKPAGSNKFGGALNSLARRRLFLQIESLEERVLLTSQPDLILQAFNAGSPSAVLGNQFQLPVTWTVKNQGTFAPAQSWSDSFYLSNKTTFDSSAIFVGSLFRSDSLPLAINGTYTATTTLTIPNVALTGNQNLLVVTDGSNSAHESNTSNNSASTPLQLINPNVNLSVSNVSISSHQLVAGNGNQVTVAWTVTNTGTDTAKSSWFDQVYLSNKTTLDASAVNIGSANAPSTLAPGASYTQTQVITLPNTTLLGSNLNILIQANADAEQGQTSIANTLGVITGVTVAAPGNVDLQIAPASLIAPSTATLGQTIAVTWSVKNNGAGPASASWTDAIYSSPTATFNPATAHFLTSIAAPSTLAAGSSYTQTDNVSLPGSSAGDAFIIVRTNLFNQQSETTTTNDTASSAIALSEPALAITAFTGPAAANLGDAVTLNWTVKNTSTVATAIGWSDSLYLSDTATFDPTTAKFIKSINAPISGNLAGGASYSQTAQLALPYSQIGNRFLILVADATSASNNFRGAQPVSNATPITSSSAIALGQPDLTVTLNSPPTAAILGQAFNLSWTVTNTGSAGATASWEDGVFISSSATFDVKTATQIGTVNAPTILGVGESYTVSVAQNLPSMPAGTYHIFVVADRLNDQGQNNESVDNIDSATISVTGPALSLTINSAPATTVAANGVNFPVTWTVKNISTVDAVAAWSDTIYLSNTATLNLTNSSSYKVLGSFNEPINPNGFQSQGYLAAGASYTNTQLVPVPNLPAGSYFLFVVADSSYFYSPTSGTGQAVTSTANATASTPVSLTVPDVKLVVKSATPSVTTVSAGTTMNLTYTVQNQGTAAAGSTWLDEVYISSKSTFDSTASSIGAFFFSASPLAPNGTYTASTSLTIPGNITGGPQFLLIRPDESLDQAATTTVFALPITVTIPDVKLAAAITSSPASAAQGQSITVSYKVTNTGTAATNVSFWDDEFFLSTKPTYDDSAIFLQDVQPNSNTGQLPLAAGANYTETTTFNLAQFQSGLASGNYFLLLKANEEGTQAQADASLSFTSVPITVSATATGNVDLIVSDATAPATATVGSSISLSFTVKNQGTTPTQGTWSDVVYISNSPTLNNYDTFLTSTANVSTLAGGGSYTNTLTVAISTTLSPGKHYLIFAANGFANSGINDSLGEINLGNNFFAFPITLDAPALTPTALTFTGNPVEGNSINVSWSVQNQGPVAASGFWSDNLYISDSPSFDPATAISITNFSESNHSPLAPGDSYSDSRAVTLPVVTVGDRYLLLVTNPGPFNNVGGNANRTNYVFAVPISLTAPNLAVSDFSFTPGSAEVGNQQTLSLSWTVTNTSSIATNQNWSDTVFLSPTPVFSRDTSIQLTSAPNKQALAGGSHYSTTLTNVTIPTMAAGTYYVFIAANSNYSVFLSSFNAQPESDASDNILAAASPLTLTPPDVNLQISSTQIDSTSVVAGQTVHASFVVKNAGGETAQNTWQDAIYISSSPIFSINTAPIISTFLGGQSPLAAGASYTQSTNIFIPPTETAGTYYLFYVTNSQHLNSAAQGQGESNYTDDVSAPVQISVNVPDLSIAINSAPTTAKLNDSVAVSYTVTNISTQYAAYSGWEDAVYLSDTPTLNRTASSTVLLIEKFISNSTTPLAPGGSYTQNLNVPLGNSTTGQHYLIFVTDLFNQQSQVTRTNDVVSSPITLSAPQVNLQVVPGSTSVNPTSANAGDDVSVSWSVKNVGADPANGAWTDNIYISTKNTFDSSAQSLFALVSPPSGSLPLATGASYQQTDNFVFLSSTLAPGSYFLYVVTNDNSGQSETNTADNVSDPIPLTISPPPSPDLQVTTVTATPVDIIAGSTISVSWTVTNTGDATGAGSWEDAVYLSSSPTLDGNAQLLGVFSENQNLASGTGQYSDTQNVSLTDLAKTITGDAYILVQADFTRILAESDFSNNAAASSVLQVSAPSFSVTSLTAPGTGVIGSTIPLSWTVTNTSIVDAQVSWTDAVYISPNNTLDGNAHLVALFPSSMILAAGASYTQNQNVTLPLTFTGTEFLIIVADQGNSQPQEGSANVATTAIDISGADLAVTAVNGPTSSVSIGQSTTVSWTVQNVGAGSASQAWSDAIYISSKSTFDGTATLLKTVPVGIDSPLAEGASYTHSSSVNIPAGLVVGNYFILIQANFNHSQLEVNSDNNILASSSFAIGGPDLVVSTAGAPASANFGQSITVNWTVQNSGNGDATQNWTDGVYLSSKNSFDNTAILLKRLPSGDNSPLAAGANYNQSTQVTLPLTAQSANGTYFIFVVTNDQVQEEETNFANDASIPQQISLTVPPLPDLVVPAASITVPSTAFNNQQIVISWVDKNTGSVTATGPWIDRVYYSTSSDGSLPTLLGNFTFPNSLAAGVSVQLTQAVTLPANLGNIWIVVQTDADQGANEGIHNDNDTSVSPTPINVTQQPLPDLVVTQITPPNNGVLSGTSIPVSFVVANQGTAPTTAAVWQDWVILSQDPNLAQTYYPNAALGFDQILNNQPVILGFQNPSFLDVGRSYTQTVNIPLPINAQGTWYIYVVPDGTGSHHAFTMDELSRADKLKISAGFTVALSPTPALVVNPVIVPPVDFSGQPTHVTWTVTNTGTGATAVSSWTDAVYMSTKNTLDDTATLLGSFNHEGALAPGGVYAQSQTVTLPVGVSGLYYFFVKTDSTGRVFQNGDTDGNVGVTVAAATINLTPPPDLRVAIPSTPAAVLAGHPLTINYQVTNAGAGSASNLSWTDSYYLSPTPGYDPGTAITLGHATHNGSLAAGAGYANSVVETVPNGVNGNFYLVVVADSDNLIFEIDPAGKTGVSTGLIQVSSKPADLAVTANGPASGSAGGSVLLSWKVTNQGTGDTVATTWYDYVYAESATTLDNHGIFLGAFPHSGLLNAGDSYSQMQPVGLPINSSGTLNLFVVTNQPLPTLNPLPPPVFEVNSANDTSSAVSITVTQSLADLKVTSVTAPANGGTGGSVTVSWTVANSGTGATNSNFWYDDLWLSTSTSLQSGGQDIYLGTVQHSNPLAPGASYSTSLSVILPANLSPGTYSFIVGVDRPVRPPNSQDSSVNLVFESAENNNQAHAIPAASITVNSTPELETSAVRVVSPAIAGGQLSVGYTVTNNGVATGNVAIKDFVYLSFDQVLSSSDRFLGSITNLGGLDAGASYTQNAQFQLPAGLAGTFSVFVVSNGDNHIFQNDKSVSIGYDHTPLQVVLPPAADLVAGTVTIPANAVPGQNITITYQVTNNGANPANGSWNDSLYLSTTPSFVPGSPLIGTLVQTQNLAANGGTYTGTLTAPLPAVNPGSYYVVVRTNILNSFPELTQANNLSASLTQTSIDVPALTLGTPTTGTLAQTQSAYYKVDVTAGQTLKVNLTSQAATSSNELYVSFGSIPTRGHYDLRFSSPAANQQIAIPSTQAGTYYVFVYGAAVPSGPEQFALTAAIVPFSITGVNPATVGNAGKATIEIDGARFDRATTFQLVGPGGVVVPASASYTQDSATAFITFDLTGKPLGSYQAVAITSTGTQTHLDGALTVTQGVGGHLKTNVALPSVTLVGRISSFTVNYANTGDSDIPAPLLTIYSPTDTAMGFTPDAVFSGETQPFLGVSPSGPAGILRPGESASLTLYFQSPAHVGDPYNIQLQIVTTDDTQPIDPDVVTFYVADTYVNSANYQTLLAKLLQDIGPNWGDYVNGGWARTPPSCQPVRRWEATTTSETCSTSASYKPPRSSADPSRVRCAPRIRRSPSAATRFTPRTRPTSISTPSKGFR